MADIQTVKLIMDNSQPVRQLTEWQKQLVQAKKALQDAYNAGDTKGAKKLEREVARLESNIKQATSSAQSLERAMTALDRANPKQLRATIKEINRQLSSGAVERGSEQWKRLTAMLREAKGEMQAIKDESTAAGQMEGGGGLLARLRGGVQLLATAYQQLTSAISGYVNEYAQLAESQAAVTKYTGLTTDQVQALNKEFAKLDTRTPREKLNALAADAGRLGITGKKDVFDFVDAANQLNVALGEDLGDDAVKNIGKLAQLFGDADSLGLKQAMLATGSAINELGQTSSAAEGYMAEFAARLAGIAKQSGLTQAEVLGLASVMDQSAVGAEVGATALSRILQKLYQSPAEMARAARLDVAQFTGLLKTDANAALLQFAQGMQGLGGLENMAPVLKDLSITGSGVTQVLSTLAGNVEKVKATQQQATEAFRQATSVTREYDVANNTVQARLEKQQQRLADLRTELGQGLLPLYESLTSGAATLGQGLLAVLRYFAQHTTLLRQLAVVIALYNAQAITAAVVTRTVAVAQGVWHVVLRVGTALHQTYKLAVTAASIATATYTGNLTRAAAAQRLFNTLLKSTPWGIALAAITAIGLAVYNMARQTTAAEQAQKTLNKVQQDAAAKTAAQKQQIELLQAAAKNENLTTKERIKAINKLNEIIPGYNAQLDETTNKYTANATALQGYLDKLQRKYELEGAKDELKRIGKERAALRAANKQREAEISKLNQKREAAAKKADSATPAISWGSGTSAGNAYRSGQQMPVLALTRQIKNLEDETDHANQKLAKLNEEAAAIMGTYGTDLQKDAATTTATAAGSTTTTGGGSTATGGSTTTTTSADPALQAIKDRADAARAAAAAAYIAGKTDALQYHREMQRIEMQAATETANLYKAGTKQRTDAEAEITELTKQQAAERAAWSQRQIKTDYEADLAALEQRYYEGKVAEEAYLQQKNALTLAYLEKQRDLYAQAGDVENWERAKAAYEKEAQDQQLAQAKRFYEQAARLREQYLELPLEQQMQAELDMARQFHEKGLLNEEQYQIALAAIRKKYSPAGSSDGSDGSSDGASQSAAAKGESPLANANLDSTTSAALRLMTVFDQLNQRISDGTATWEDYAAAGLASVSLISSGMQAASQLVQANYDLEIAKVEKRYDAEIEAAGNNTKKVQQLETEKEAELAKLKTEKLKKSTNIQIAQAVMDGASAAIAAYASASRVNWILGPIAAAMAVAATAVQIATIKKQAEAQAEGYYEGGYTPAVGDRNVAGVVHGGEFVVNARAVKNPALVPLLNYIDQAQRTGRAATLTSGQVAAAASLPYLRAGRAFARGGMAGAALPAAADPATTPAAAQSKEIAAALTTLTDQLARGIEARAVISGNNGIAAQLKRYDRLRNV